MAKQTRSRRGRPRNELAAEAIRRAAVDLLRTHAYRQLTIDRIASRAGVGRQTIYRWWHSKADVILEALNTRAIADVPLRDLDTFVRTTFTIAPTWVPILRALMSEALQNPRFDRRFRAEFIDRRRRILQSIVRRELPDADPARVADHVFGPLWYLVLTRPTALTTEYAEHVLEIIRSRSFHQGGTSSSQRRPRRGEHPRTHETARRPVAARSR
jgi:AcrR family transcriptional regulator